MTKERSRAKKARRPEIKEEPQAIESKSGKARQGGSRSWLLLTYKVPAEPAKRRIALWRKLKALGAIYLQSGVCLLPKIDAHERRLKVLQNEIFEMDGDAVLLETVGLDHAQEQRVIARFSAERDEAYREFISRCDDFDGEIAKERGNGKFTYAEVEEKLRNGSLVVQHCWRNMRAKCSRRRTKTAQAPIPPEEADLLWL